MRRTGRQHAKDKNVRGMVAASGSRRRTVCNRPAVGSTIGLILSIVVGLVLAVPSAASAVLLSGSRLEDQIALKSSGFPGIEKLSFNPELFNQSTDLWIARLLVVLRTVKGIADRGWMAGLAALADEKQQQIFQRMKEADPVRAFFLQAIGMRPGKMIEFSEEDFLRSPFSIAYLLPLVDDLWAGLKWGLLAFIFLPLALSLAAVYFWIVPIATGLYETAKSWRRRRSVAGESRGTGLSKGSKV